MLKLKIGYKMVNVKAIFFLLCASANLLGSHEIIKVKESLGDLKRALEQDSQKDRSLKEKELASAYYKDQDLDRAFQSYLNALNHAEIEATPLEMGSDEEAFYKEALRVYLSPKQESPQDVAELIKDIYTGTLRLHPDYYHLGYLLALAYANLSQFDRFFDLFYASYLRLPDHYLAYKTKAILHIKLFERAKTPIEKEKERAQVLLNLEEAKKRYGKDLSLYKMQIAFSEDNERNLIVQKMVLQILDNNLEIPRADLPYYFDQLLAYGQLDLAEKFLKRARQWYPYSRTLDAAEEMLQRKLQPSKE